MTHYTDSKFDAIRKMPATDLIGIRMGWSGDAILAAQVAEYDAACARETRAELLKMAASIQARPDDAFDSRDRNFYL